MFLLFRLGVFCRFFRRFVSLLDHWTYHDRRWQCLHAEWRYASSGAKWRLGSNWNGVTLSARIMVQWKMTISLKTLELKNVQSFAKLKETSLGDEIHPFFHWTMIVEGWIDSSQSSFNIISHWFFLVPGSIIHVLPTTTTTTVTIVAPVTMEPSEGWFEWKWCYPFCQNHGSVENI